MSTDELGAAVRASVTREACRRGDRPGVAGAMQRLCRVAVTTLPATGVGVSVLGSDGMQLSAVASDQAHDEVEELQFIMGEGPCLDAFHSGHPVLVPDLGLAAATRWPGYAPAALGHGVRAVFAFPLHVGVVHLGALDVYRDHTGPLSTQAITVATTFAEVAMHTLLEAQTATSGPGTNDTEPAGGRRDPPIPDTIEPRLELYQAQGMVMMQLGVTLGQAMARLRAHAYAHDLPLNAVAADVVSRRLTLSDDCQ